MQVCRAVSVTINWDFILLVIVLASYWIYFKSMLYPTYIGPVSALSFGILAVYIFDRWEFLNHLHLASFVMATHSCSCGNGVSFA